jgi:hypothetical protein
MPYANKEKEKAYRKKYRLCHTERIKEQTKIYYHKHKERLNAYSTLWQKQHKEARKQQHYKKKYGITLEDYNKILDSQSGICAICQQTEVISTGKTKKINPLGIDHCHKTGRIRGLLCSKCNIGLGFLEKLTVPIERYFNYLNQNKEKNQDENKGDL